MLKPKSYDETQSSSNEFTPVALGGHYAVIKGVSERESRTGKPMCVVCIDFDQQDDQAGYFQNRFDEDDRQDKKWPNQGTQYVVTEDNEGKCSKSFKSFCTSFENSNGIKISWGTTKWADQFKGKKIGVVFGEVENEYNGEVRTRRDIRWFCDYQKALTQKVPGKKELPKPAPNDGDMFMPIPEGSGDEIPW